MQRVNELTDVIPPANIWLNPDCGFGTFAERPMATPEVATGKLKALAAAAERLRQQHS